MQKITLIAQRAEPIALQANSQGVRVNLIKNLAMCAGMNCQVLKSQVLLWDGVLLLFNGTIAVI